MNTVEFDANVKNGIIEIPNKFIGRIPKKVKVRFKVTEKNKSGNKNIIQKLFENPLEAKDFKPMLREEIYER